MGLFFRRKPAPATVVVPSSSSAASGAMSGVGGLGGGMGGGMGADTGGTSNPLRESRIFEIGSDFLKRARGHRTSALSAKFYSDAMMEWSMKDPEFKVQMFRFVDTFPVLKDPEAIFDHLQDYLSQPGVKVPPLIAGLLKAGSLLKSTASNQIGSQIKGMASKFIAGTDSASALPGLKGLWDDGIAFSVDLLGEVCVSDMEADDYARKYLDLIENLPVRVAAWKAQPRLETDHLGPIPRTNVSVKVSALSAKLDAIDTEGSIAELQRRLLPILETARDRGVFVNFDMEHHALKDLTIELFQRCVQKIDFQAGLAMQAYLKSGPDDARRMCDWARKAQKCVTVRLVKGAYWDAETIKAELHGWPVPVWPQKWMTDRCFEQMTEIFLDACPAPAKPAGLGEAAPARPKPVGIKLALGSHNARSIAAALAGLEARGLPTSAIELQMLHGMADQLKHAAAELNLRVREYVPVGEMIPGMAYLVRRLLENTSNESWLKAGFLDNADAGSLLRAPAAAPTTTPPKDLSDPHRHQLSPAVEGLADGKPFMSEPFRDFSDAGQRLNFASSIARATVPRIANDTSIQRAGEMVAAASAVFPAWRDTDPLLRARVLTESASLMRQQRDALAGVMIKESGKTWREADADVCEAIDFCDYYARVAPPMFARKRLGRFIGELDETTYEPRGVAVVISPWNFPLAICTGMTVAALVTGNPVIVKPAEQTPGIASILCDILRSAMSRVGVPAALARDVLHFCPAPGETVGAALVRDPRVHLVAFTGSRDVGLDILSASAPRSPFGPERTAPPSHLKHVICEMGGKNALIIDQSADLDEAVLAARASAFGFQGQKCSALSRCIVVDPAGPSGPAITHFTKRLVEASRALVIGDPLEPGTDVGPVIDAEAAAKITGFIDRAKAQGLPCVQVPIPMDKPFVAASINRFIPPTIFTLVPETSELAREEIFGPVLSILHAKDFTDALRIANSLPYKLTGGAFTRKPTHIEQAKREFRVGNLYLNRGITGALVARHPFGGFAMSGGGTKAGGADYLLHFVHPRAIAENTLRRGFAPEL